MQFLVDVMSVDIMSADVMFNWCSVLPMKQLCADNIFVDKATLVGHSLIRKVRMGLEWQTIEKTFIFQSRIKETNEPLYSKWYSIKS